MPRLARVVLPNYPHHITQRGVRQQNVFFNPNDYQEYLRLLKHWCNKEQVEIWAYCLMANHVHLIATPNERSGLARAIGETHRRYTRMINARQEQAGHLWQGRFFSFPMDERYLLKAAAYVELNPVRAGMVKYAWDYQSSSVHAHLSGHDKLGLVKVNRLLELFGDWKEYLQQAQPNNTRILEQHERTSRPLGDALFISKTKRLGT